MPFFNRKNDLKRLKALLSGEPNLVWFVYGPINSGKTALLMKVFEELPENYRVFYINFRGRDVEKVEDLMRVLFRVKKGKFSEKTKEFIKEILKGGTSVIEKLKGIPIPQKIFDILFGSVNKAEDIFAFLEEYFESIVEEGYRPVFVLDEMQTIKEVLNATGKPVISGLFNFMVRLTKETHLCHCLCATSDCLFIENIYSNAHLEGRARYILVDDLSKEEAFEVYEGFGFENKDLIWDFIGGKIGDMIALFEEKKRGYPEKDALQEMLKIEIARLENLIEKVEMGFEKFYIGNMEISINPQEVRETLMLFKKNEEIPKEKINPIYRNFLIQENILFYNPLEGEVRPQGRLLWRAIKEAVKD